MKKISLNNAELVALAAKHDTVDAPPVQQIAAAQQAVRAALRDHKLAGNSIAVWRDGKVVLVPPEQIEA